MSLEISESAREGVDHFVFKGPDYLRRNDGDPREGGSGDRGRTPEYILDLSHVEYVDSTGLGGMVICYTTLKRQGGALKLVNPNKRNIELLALTKLYTVFEVFTEQQDAVNSFFPGREIKRFDILAFVQAHEQD